MIQNESLAKDMNPFTVKGEDLTADFVEILVYVGALLEAGEDNNKDSIEIYAAVGNWFLSSLEVTLNENHGASECRWNKFVA